MTKTYNNPPIGCYLDQGLRNATEHDVETVRLAESYGFKVDGEMERILESADHGTDDSESIDDLEALTAMADDAIAFLNDQETRSFLYWSNDGERGAFGLWPDVEGAENDCEFVSYRSHDEARRNGAIELCDPDDSAYPASDYRGEWLHVNDHGNATLYVRESTGKAHLGPDKEWIEEYRDTEIWSVV